MGVGGHDLGLKPPGYTPASLRDLESTGRCATWNPIIVIRTMMLPRLHADAVFSPFLQMKGLRC